MLFYAKELFGCADPNYWKWFGDVPAHGGARHKHLAHRSFVGSGGRLTNRRQTNPALDGDRCATAQDPACDRLMTVPGIGPIISSADFGAWLGFDRPICFGNGARPSRAFTSRLSTGRSSFPLLDMTTVTGLLCCRDFHLLESQLASLHWPGRASQASSDTLSISMSPSRIRRSIPRIKPSRVRKIARVLASHASRQNPRVRRGNQTGGRPLVDRVHQGRQIACAGRHVAGQPPSASRSGYRSAEKRGNA